MKRLIILAAAALLFIPGAYAQEAPQINKKNLVIKEWNTDPKGSSKVLDHVTTFSAEGKKIEEIEYNSDGQKWRKRFEYGPDGKLSKELVYDNRNRLQTYKTFEWNEFSRKKVQYTYSAKGKLLSIKQYEYIAQDAGK
jgi:antitoxin component YwqK of YwqJK toxin-antitoxin module